MTLTYRQELVIEQVRAYVDSNPLRKFSIPELMDYSKMSKDKLMRGFKESYGQSVYNYQLNVAMEHARNLLDEGVELKALAGHLGYCSVPSFARSYFKIHQEYPHTRRSAYHPKVLMTKSLERKLNEVRSLIDSTPFGKRSRAELVNLSGLSVHTLSVGFKVLFGEAVSRYQLRVSMQTAYDLLRKDYSIENIVRLSGYSNKVTFGRAFYRMYKKLPREILRNGRKK